MNNLLQDRRSRLASLHNPLEVVKCKKCGKIIAKPKELTRIINPIVVKNYDVLRTFLSTLFLLANLKRQIILSR